MLRLLLNQPKAKLKPEGFTYCYVRSILTVCVECGLRAGSRPRSGPCYGIGAGPITDMPTARGSVVIKLHRSEENRGMIGRSKEK